MKKNCGVCQKPKKCALIEVSAYDPDGDTGKPKLHIDVCSECVDLLSPIVSAMVQSWCKEKPGRVSKLQNVKV